MRESPRVLESVLTLIMGDVDISLEALVKIVLSFAGLSVPSLHTKPFRFVTSRSCSESSRHESAVRNCGREWKVLLVHLLFQFQRTIHTSSPCVHSNKRAVPVMKFFVKILYLNHIPQILRVSYYHSLISLESYECRLYYSLKSSFFRMLRKT